jgi:CARDB
MKSLFSGLTVLAVGGLLAVGALLPAATTAASLPPLTPPRASLSAFDCHRALQPDNRSVSVTAVMRPLPGTRHMAVKFDLLMFGPDVTSPLFIHAGDLGSFRSPTNVSLGQLPGDIWNLQKSVVALAAPATYRFRVVFRWTGDGGRTLGVAVRYSRRCHQPELRPDLLVQSITVTPVPNHPELDVYGAVIENDGNTGAGPFEVLFAPADGSDYRTQTIAFLRAHASIEENFVGPACSSTTDPTIIADSTQEVDDLNRANNSLTATCPASSAG